MRRPSSGSGITIPAASAHDLMAFFLRNTIKELGQKVWPFTIVSGFSMITTSIIMARLISLVCLLAVVYSATAQENNVADNEIVNPRRINNGEELVSAIVDDCFAGDDQTQSSMSCLRMKVLTYLDSVMGGDAHGRSLEEEKSDAERLDAMILSRVTRYLNTHEFKVQLPDFLFQEAVLTFRPAKGISDFKVEFPAKQDQDEDRSYSEARDMMKKKMLLPLLLLLKLKMKALTPILLAVIGLKAMKALVMSKIAILLVVGFLVVQLCKKLGMAMPMPMPVPAEPTPYGAPAPAPPASSYEPGWDSGNANGGNGGNGGNGNGGGPYSRVWDAQQMAYNAYYNPQQVQQAQQTQS